MATAEPESWGGWGRNSFPSSSASNPIVTYTQGLSKARKGSQLLLTPQSGQREDSSFSAEKAQDHKLILFWVFGETGFSLIVWFRSDSGLSRCLRPEVLIGRCLFLPRKLSFLRQQIPPILLTPFPLSRSQSLPSTILRISLCTTSNDSSKDAFWAN